mmetsp:Transcript_13049/g.36734  ORF Transcript_13049/g.36734 Transcript_13049/m.36734 type:complete len:293 (-) Transcript_13049:486-1364(-)
MLQIRLRMNRIIYIGTIFLSTILVTKIMTARADIAGSSPPKKTIFLVRHAESEENRRISALCRTFQSLKKFSLPKTADVSTSTELLNVSAQVDSDVSEIGANQIAHMGEKLRKEKFVESSGISLVVHSPLQRARQTSEGMLGCMTASSSDNSLKEKRADTVSRVTETELLLEKTPAEWTPMYHKTFLKRISDFERWLGEQPEETIALVGHSQFFKAMLGLDYKFGNCEVWKVDFASELSEEESEEAAAMGTDEKTNESADPSSASSSPTTSSRWSNLVKLYSCDVASSPRTV